MRTLNHALPEFRRVFVIETRVYFDCTTPTFILDDEGRQFSSHRLRVQLYDDLARVRVEQNVRTLSFSDSVGVHLITRRQLLRRLGDRLVVAVSPGRPDFEALLLGRRTAIGR